MSWQEHRQEQGQPSMHIPKVESIGVDESLFGRMLGCGTFDRPTGAQIARHLEAVFAAVPRCVCKLFARADAGFWPKLTGVAFSLR